MSLALWQAHFYVFEEDAGAENLTAGQYRLILVRYLNSLRGVFYEAI